MQERKGAVTFQGNPLTLVGDEIKVQGRAPEAELTDNSMATVRLSSFRGKVCVILTVPSLDTPVCDLETRRFNKEAANLNPNIAILTVSRDLPFAQKRWCGAAQVDRVTTLSDYKDANFGAAYGVLIKELKLLARAVFIVDKEGIVRYTQVVSEITKEPNYDAVLRAIREIAK